MKALAQKNYELVVQRKERHILSYHTPKRSKVKKGNKPFMFQISSFKTDSNRKFKCLGFF